MRKLVWGTKVGDDGKVDFGDLPYHSNEENALTAIEEHSKGLDTAATTLLTLFLLE